MTRFTPAFCAPSRSARAAAASEDAGRPEGLGRGESALMMTSTPFDARATLAASVASPSTMIMRSLSDRTDCALRATPTTSCPRSSASRAMRCATCPPAPKRASFTGRPCFGARASRRSNRRRRRSARQPRPSRNCRARSQCPWARRIHCLPCTRIIAPSMSQASRKAMTRVKKPSSRAMPPNELQQRDERPGNRRERNAHLSEHSRHSAQAEHENLLIAVHDENGRKHQPQHEHGAIDVLFGGCGVREHGLTGVGRREQRRPTTNRSCGRVNTVSFMPAATERRGPHARQSKRADRAIRSHIVSEPAGCRRIIPREEHDVRRSRIPAQSSRRTCRTHARTAAALFHDARLRHERRSPRRAAGAAARPIRPHRRARRVAPVLWEPEQIFPLAVAHASDLKLTDEQRVQIETIASKLRASNAPLLDGDRHAEARAAPASRSKQSERSRQHRRRPQRRSRSRPSSRAATRSARRVRSCTRTSGSRATR